ncbi:MAG: hypothetical protein WD716_00605 [Fimbriimonadaceae bacterium]
MNAAHLHLVVNHLPFAFAFVTLIVMLVGLVSKSTAIKKLSLGLMLLVALSSAGAYFSGTAAEESQFGPDSPGYEQLERHEDSAKVTWIIGLATGIIGFGGLFAVRRLHDIPFALMVLPLVLLLVSMYFFVKTANLGGQIKHPETRSDAATKFLNPTE